MDVQLRNWGSLLSTVETRALHSKPGCDGGLFRLPLVQHAWSIPRSLFLPSALRVWTTPRVLFLGGIVHYLLIVETGHFTQCMVRRRTARGLKLGEAQSA